MNDAGTVIVADVYAAGEAPIPGVNRDALVEGLRARGHRSVVPLPGPEHLAEMVHAIARAGRLRGLPRRRQHHAMGGRAAGASWPRCRRRSHAAGRMIALPQPEPSGSTRCRRCAAACRRMRRSAR